MTVFNEQRFTAEFLVSEANGYRSRAEGDIDASTGALEPGTLLGRRADGSYVRHSSAAADGSEAIAAILLIPAATDVTRVSMIVRDAEVVPGHLTYEAGATAAQITAANTALAALGIITRASGITVT